MKWVSRAPHLIDQFPSTVSTLNVNFPSKKSELIFSASRCNKNQSGAIRLNSHLSSRLKKMLLAAWTRVRDGFSLYSADFGGGLTESSIISSVTLCSRGLIGVGEGGGAATLCKWCDIMTGQLHLYGQLPSDRWAAEPIFCVACVWGCMFVRVYWAA